MPACPMPIDTHALLLIDKLLNIVGNKPLLVIQFSVYAVLSLCTKLANSLVK